MSATPTPDTGASREPLPPPASGPPDLEVRTGSFRPSHLIPFVPALVPTALLIAIVVELLISSKFTNFGLAFWGPHWIPSPSTGAPTFGIAVFITGSFLTAIPALLLALLIGIGIAVASTSYLPRWLTRWLDPFVDLLAGIPSIVYGIWGYLLVAPFFGTVINPVIYHNFHWVPGFGAPAPAVEGVGLPVAIFILMLMALPITTLLIRDALRAVPRDLWEAGLGLGATRWETTRRVAIPYAMRGIVSAGFLGFGRAFGETVMVAMVLNVVPAFPLNFYSGTSTMAAEMFTQLDSAYGNGQFLAALSEMALVLLAISLVVNIVGRRLISRFATYDVPGL
ncbi:MAG TPA: phosphate ABC transporter permease subunit PstC [Thermoplasmata archaeon]|nr:phosphate ABC transporter permease subunit PstC [Thermoplasmata archaeon]